MQSAQASKGAATQSATLTPKCRLCSETFVYRMERQGLVEKWIYSVFGYYPWRCNACRKKIYLRRRLRGDEA